MSGAHLRLLLVAGLLTALLVSTPATAGVRTCDGRPATIQRGDADNDIFGTTGNDVIVAGGGDDLVIASAGRDRVCGEAGNDEIDGQEGGDLFLNGGPGSDFVGGGPGSDTVAGAGGNDGGTATWRGEPFGAGLEGDDGNDLVSGGAGSDGNGCDQGVPFPAGDGLEGGRGDDTLRGGPNDDDIEDRQGPRTGAPSDVDRIVDREGCTNFDLDDDDGDDFVCFSQGIGSTDPGDEVLFAPKEC